MIDIDRNPVYTNEGVEVNWKGGFFSVEDGKDVSLFSYTKGIYILDLDVSATGDSFYSVVGWLLSSALLIFLSSFLMLLFLSVKAFIATALVITVTTFFLFFRPIMPSRRSRVEAFRDAVDHCDKLALDKIKMKSYIEDRNEVRAIESELGGET